MKVAPIPVIEGYTITSTPAWWIRCDTCGDEEIVFGDGADGDALAWSEKHSKEHDS